MTKDVKEMLCNDVCIYIYIRIYTRIYIYYAITHVCVCVTH